jgi:hypothetical protein
MEVFEVVVIGGGVAGLSARGCLQIRSVTRPARLQCCHAPVSYNVQQGCVFCCWHHGHSSRFIGLTLA